MKKKNLYQLVKQSLKEVLQEQRRDRRLGPDDFFVDPKTGELIPKDIAGAPTGTGTGPQKTPDSKEDQISFTPDIDQNFDDIFGFSLNTNPPLNPPNTQYLDLWLVNDDPNEECIWVSVSDNFIDNNNITVFQAYQGGTTNTIVGIPGAGGYLAYNELYPGEFAPSGTPFTTANVLSFLAGALVDNNGNSIPSPFPNGLFSQTNPYQGWYFSDTCNACTYTTTGDYTVTNTFDPGGAPASLAIVEDGSCDFVACDGPGYTNYLCNLLPAVCTQGTPDVGNLLNEVVDTGLCEIVGCLDENSAFDPAGGLYGLPNNGWVCLTSPNVCTQGTINQTYTTTAGATANVANYPGTNDISLCNPTTAVLGCTVSGYTNYNPNANVEDGICEYEGCLDQNSGGVPNTNWICSQVQALCNNGIPNATYLTTSYNVTSLPDPNGVPFNAIYTDDGSCVQDDIFGCLDSTEILPGVLQFPTYNPAHVQDTATYSTPADQNTALCGDAVITGCTDPIANNYHCDDANAATGIYACSDTDGDGIDDIPLLSYINPNIAGGATLTTPLVVDDGSCDYDLDDDGVLDDDEVVGCTDSNADNYGLQPDGTPCTDVNPSGCTDGGVLGAFTAQNHIDNGCTYTVYGCTDSNSPAYLDPANLTAPQTTTNTTIVNQVSATDTSDPCQLGPGCTDPNAINYVGAAAAPFTTDDGSCLFTGCGNEFANNPTIITSTLTQYNNMVANVDDGTCTFEYCNQQGISNYVCMANPQLCNVNGIACGTTPCPSGVPNTSYNSLDTTGTQVTVSIVITDTGCNADGCVDPAAINYDPNAQTDDGTCRYKYCNDSDAFNYSPVRPLIPNALINNGNQNSVNNSGASWILNQDVPDAGACEFEGCPDPSAVPGGVSQETYPGSGIYFYNSNNDGCQTDPNPTNPNYIPGLNSTGQLDPQNTDCCATEGCIDDGNLGAAGQQFWIQNGYDTTLGIAAYPGVSATNYDSSATVGNNTCQYNIGCTDPLAPNYDQNADIDTDITQCLPYCKRITAVQCNPNPDPNGYAPGGFGGNFEHTITIPCAHLLGNTPDVGDEFWHPNGVLYTSPAFSGTQGTPCPSFQAQNFGIAPPPFGAVGYPGQILACNPNSSAGSPQNAPMNGGSAYCPGGYDGCTYIFAAANPHDPSPDKTADTGRWTLYPANTIQTYGGEEDKKASADQINAVFRITNVEDDVSPNVFDLAFWRCTDEPPATPISTSIKDFDLLGNPIGIEPFKGPKPKINEVEISKILRKSLTKMFKNKK